MSTKYSTTVYLTPIVITSSTPSHPPSTKESTRITSTSVVTTLFLTSSMQSSPSFTRVSSNFTSTYKLSSPFSTKLTTDFLSTTTFGFSTLLPPSPTIFISTIESVSSESAITDSSLTQSEIRTKITKYETIVDAITNVTNAISSASNRSQRSTTIPCADFLSLVETFTSISTKIKKYEQIKSQSLTISNSNVDTCSVDEAASLSSYSTTLKSNINKLEDIISKLQSRLTTTQNLFTTYVSPTTPKMTFQPSTQNPPTTYVSSTQKGKTIMISSKYQKNTTKYPLTIIQSSRTTNKLTTQPTSTIFVDEKMSTVPSGTSLKLSSVFLSAKTQSVFLSSVSHEKTSFEAATYLPTSLKIETTPKISSTSTFIPESTPTYIFSSKSSFIPTEIASTGIITERYSSVSEETTTIKGAFLFSTMSSEINLSTDRYSADSLKSSTTISTYAPSKILTFSPSKTTILYSSSKFSKSSPETPIKIPKRTTMPESITFSTITDSTSRERESTKRRPFMTTKLVTTVESTFMRHSFIETTSDVGISSTSELPTKIISESFPTTSTHITTNLYISEKPTLVSSTKVTSVTSKQSTEQPVTTIGKCSLKQLQVYGLYLFRCVTTI